MPYWWHNMRSLVEITQYIFKCGYEIGLLLCMVCKITREHQPVRFLAQKSYKECDFMTL